MNYKKKLYNKYGLILFWWIPILICIVVKENILTGFIIGVMTIIFIYSFILLLYGGRAN